MSDFIPGRETRTQGIEASRVFVGGNEAEFVFGRGTQIFPNIPVQLYGTTEVRMVEDAEGYWFEFGFRIDCTLSGNSASGFTDAGNYFKAEIEQSYDLVIWSMGKFYPAAVPVVDLGDGVMEYWSRCTVPAYYSTVLADFSATSTLQGKSITAISLLGNVISLSYPYSMPSQAAALQTAIRAAGFSGAVVASTSAAISVEIENHTPSGPSQLTPTMTGSSVTGVSFGGTTISLSYPYSMPTQKAALQTALRAAGFSGAVVVTHADEWSVTIPNVTSGGAIRPFSIQITPGDPFPVWDFTGNYQGLAPADVIVGNSGNVRSSGGEVTPEAPRQFGRLRFSGGTRYNPYLTP